MPEVTIRDLRRAASKIVDRVGTGESLTVTRNGRPVAELRPLRASPLSATTLLRRWRRLPPLDPMRTRADLETFVDPIEW